MDNEITGLPKRATSLPSESTVFGKKGVVSENQGVDFQGYGGAVDTIAPIEFVPQTFFVKTVYEASAQIPSLLTPDPEGVTGPQPYGFAEQRLVMKFFSKKVLEMLQAKSSFSAEQVKEVYDAILSNKTLSDPSLAQLAQKVKQSAIDAAREQGRLPKSWTPESTASEDWIPSPLQPYDEAKQEEINLFYDNALQKAFTSYAAEVRPPLTQKESAALQEAIATGKVSSAIAERFISLTKLANEKTQKAYGLSETWTKGTANIEEWKPIYLGIVAPLEVSKAQAESILVNVETLLVDYQKAGVNVSKALPPDDPNQRVLESEYRKAITGAIQALKDVLRDLQLKDAGKTKESAIAKLSLSDTKTKIAEEASAKRQEAQENQRKAEKTAAAMKIFGPIIAALMTIVGAVLSVFGGIGTPVIAAGIAIGIAMTAYSIVDSATGCTQKLMSAFNEWLEKTFPDNPLVQKIIKAVIIAVVVIILAIAIAATGGGAAGSFAAQFAKEAVRLIAIQMLLMTIMSSNIIPELIGEILRNQGVDKKDSQIAEIVAMVIAMIVSMVAMGAAGKTSGTATKGVLESAKEAARSVGQMASRVLEIAKKLITNIKDGIIEGTEAVIKLLKNLINQLLQALKALPQAISELPGKIRDAIIKSVEQIKAAAGELLEIIKTIPSKLKELPRNLINGLEKAAETLQSAMNELNANMKLAAIAAGDLAAEAIEEAIKKVQELVGKALKSLGQAGQDIWEGIKETGRGYKNFIDIIKDLRKISGSTGAELAKAKEALAEHVKGALGSTKNTLRITETTIKIVTGIETGRMGLRTADLLRETGRLEESEAIIKAVMQLLDKMMANIQSGMDSRGEFVTDLQNLLNNYYEGLNRQSTKITRTMQI